MPSDDTITRILRSCPRVAVLGAHDESWRAAFYVPQYLFEQGYTVYPVNPSMVGRSLWGQPIRARLADIPTPVDMVDVFRRPDALMGHVNDLLAMQPLPKVVWLQLGVRLDGFARVLQEAGVEVVQDRCTLADHKRLGLGAPRLE